MHDLVLEFAVVLCQLRRNGIVTGTDLHAVGVTGILGHIRDVVVQYFILHQGDIQKTAVSEKGVDTGRHTADQQVLTIQLSCLRMERVRQGGHRFKGGTYFRNEEFLAASP